MQNVRLRRIAMKHSIRKMKNAHKRISQHLQTKTPQKTEAKKTKRAFGAWADRSREFMTTLPSLTEMREEFADWHSFERLSVNELNPAFSG
jgi:hypothetical protein